MPEQRVILEPTHYYHIYNHAVGRENLFDGEDDYRYFLEKMKEYILPVSDVLCYCLLPNHFHLVVRMKNKKDIVSHIISEIGQLKFEKGMAGNEYYISERLSKIYSNLFNTYAKHCNFRKNRTGSLFKRAFMRSPIEDMKYLIKLICYVHRNPVEANFTQKPQQWKYSSFNAIVGKNPTLIQRAEIINLFGDIENFKYCHDKYAEI